MSSAFRKYFLGIGVPDPFAEEIEAFKTELCTLFGLKAAQRSPPHITLHRPFQWKEGDESTLLRELGRFRFNKRPEIGLQDFAAFVPRVIYVNVLQNEELLQLHGELSRFAQKQLGLLNETGDERGFHPHVTIAFRDLRKNRFQEVWRLFESRRYQARFTATAVTLFRMESRWEPYRSFNLRP